MPRAALIWPGVLALLLIAAPEAHAAELVRRGIAPSSVALQVETPTHGAAPHEPSWTGALPGAWVMPGAPSASPKTPAFARLGASPAAAPRARGATASARALPDARAPPA